jgi:hypothetical protein
MRRFRETRAVFRHTVYHVPGYIKTEKLSAPKLGFQSDPHERMDRRDARAMAVSFISDRGRSNRTREANTGTRLNCVVNLTGTEGKYLAIDEFNEWIVRAVKDLYNTSGTIQSTKFTCEVVSPNVIPLHHASRNVLDSSGAPTYGYKHARVDDKRDVKAILGQLLEERVFSYNPGRQTTTNENLRAIPSKDLYCAGVDAIHNGDVIERYVKKKYALSAGELGAIDEDREAEDCEGDPEGGLDGLFANREPTWSMDEGGFSLED